MEEVSPVVCNLMSKIVRVLREVSDHQGVKVETINYLQFLIKTL
jgi:hypothetical protein